MGFKFVAKNLMVLHLMLTACFAYMNSDNINAEVADVVASTFIIVVMGSLFTDINNISIALIMMSVVFVALSGCKLFKKGVYDRSDVITTAGPLSIQILMIASTIVYQSKTIK